jgi:putative membrane-bound dehydrogenase-like protein
MVKAWTLAMLAALTAAGIVLASQQPAAQSSGSQWPPAVQDVPDSSPALPAAESMKHLVVAPGYHLELVAAEPLIEDPIVIDFDPDGRLWAIEMAGYMTTIAAEDEHQPLCRVVVLQDRDGDGTMDSRTVFVDGLVLPRALKVLDHGVLVGEPPNLWLMRDTNGDLKADTRELVTDKYGTREANVEHNANGLTWALDNWMHTSETDVEVRWKNGRFEVRQTLPRGQWGNSQDDGGRIYRNTNESVLHVDLVPTPYYQRNPNLLRTRGSYESLEGPNNEVNRVYPIRPTRAVNRGYQAGVLRSDGTLANYTSVASPLVYRGDRLPKELYGNVFVVEPAGNLVSRIVLSDNGNGIEAKKAYDDAEFIASTDERFRPVFLSNAPDGTLYVVDMYRGIIQHRGFITEYLRDKIVEHKLEQPIHYGRIYRVVHETTTRERMPPMSSAAASQLVQLLSHPNGWWRDTAQRLLIEKGDVSVVPELTRLATSAPEARTRLHALWTLEGLDRLERDTVVAALGDRDRDVRASAVRLAEPWLAKDEAAVKAAVLARQSDTDWAVRRQVAASAGVLPGASGEAAVAAILEAGAGDPIVVDAALSGIAGREAAVANRILAAQKETAQRATALTMLAATIARGGGDGLTPVFASIADTGRPEWQRSALLAGLEAAWTGATLPGSTPPRRAPAVAAAAPCPTCPGGRAGPGGAPAFPRESTGPGRGRGNAPPAVQVAEEPALTKVAAQPGPLADRAKKVLARLSWPGKPGAVTAAPLSAAEQAQFDRGREVYRSLCEPCHQADGRGREKVAASLVGSAIATNTDPRLAIRVLLNGKEGQVGLMPPLGATLTDQQIADVLTYVRHAWNQSAPAVAPDTAGQVRAATADRTRPWTDQELAALAGRQP